VQPNGPYLLGGLCFGGKIAFEMAQQLRAQNDEIALLALIDSYAPGHPVLLPWVQRRKAQFRLHLSNLKKLSPLESVAYMNQKTRILGGRALSTLMKIVARAYLGLGIDSPLFLRSIKAPKQRIRYTPTMYNGTIHVFAPNQAQSVCHLYDPSMGWNRLVAGGCETHIVQGKFASIITEPAVNELAEHLRNAIEKATELSNLLKRQNSELWAQKLTDTLNKVKADVLPENDSVVEQANGVSPVKSVQQ
jgi:aspartate racemase